MLVSIDIPVVYFLVKSLVQDKRILLTSLLIWHAKLIEQIKYVYWVCVEVWGQTKKEEINRLTLVSIKRCAKIQVLLEVLSCTDGDWITVILEINKLLSILVYIMASFHHLS